MEIVITATTTKKKTVNGRFSGLKFQFGALYTVWTTFIIILLCFCVDLLQYFSVPYEKKSQAGFEEHEGEYMFIFRLTIPLRLHYPYTKLPIKAISQY